MSKLAEKMAKISESNLIPTDVEWSELQLEIETQSNTGERQLAWTCSSATRQAELSQKLTEEGFSVVRAPNYVLNIQW